MGEPLKGGEGQKGGVLMLTRDPAPMHGDIAQETCGHSAGMWRSGEEASVDRPIDLTGSV